MLKGVKGFTIWGSKGLRRGRGAIPPFYLWGVPKRQYPLFIYGGSKGGIAPFFFKKNFKKISRKNKN